MHTLFCCLHENIYHIFQFLCRRLFINNLGGYGILAIPTQPSCLCIFLLHTHAAKAYLRLIAWVWQGCHTLLNMLFDK